MKNNFILTICLGLLFFLNTNLLASNKYLDAGIPASDRIWSGQDYLEAATKFSNKNIDLPTKNDIISDELFNRIISKSNLESYSNKKTSIGFRFKSYYDMFNGLNTINKLYIDKYKNGEKLSREIAEISSFILDATLLSIDLSEEYINSINDEQKKVKMIAGQEKMSNAYVTIFLSSFMMIGEKDKFNLFERYLICSAMERSLPKLKLKFNEGFKTELKIKLKSRLNDNENDQINDKLKSMVNQLDT